MHINIVGITVKMQSTSILLLEQPQTQAVRPSRSGTDKTIDTIRISEEMATAWCKVWVCGRSLLGYRVQM
jgi:hypothetical protein